MIRSKILFTTSILIGVSSRLIGLTSAANQDSLDVMERPMNATAALRHLENTSAALTREHDRVGKLIDAGPPVYPPDPCADPGSIACRQVHAVEAIDAEAESFLASVAVLDHGTDRAALQRRLAYSTAAVAWASIRVDGLVSDFTVERPMDLSPALYPPDPCGPSLVTNLELLTSAAELAARRVGTIDSCANPASVDRRLGHVVAGLDGAAARLDKLAAVGFNPQPDPPGTEGSFNPQPDPPSPDQITAQLDAIIERAEYVAATARALRPTGARVSLEGRDSLR
jgi:hypothetical protein